MRLGLVAALLFIVMSMSLLVGVAENRNIVDEDLKDDMNTLMNPLGPVFDTGWDRPLAFLSAPVEYFGAVIDIARRGFDVGIWQSGYWTLIPYFVLAPIVIVVIMGMILMMIALTQKVF